jgi:regulatory protein
MKIEPGSLAQAKNFAYKLLSYREYSTKELEDRFIRKGFEKEIRSKVINDLKSLELLNDYRFAKAFAENRIKYKPSGLALIRSELHSKGIGGNAIDSIIADIEKNYNEYEAAYNIASNKAKRFDKISSIKAKRRIYDYLSRRRFHKDIIYEVLNKVFEN